VCISFKFTAYNCIYIIHPKPKIHFISILKSYIIYRIHIAYTYLICSHDNTSTDKNNKMYTQVYYNVFAPFTLSGGCRRRRRRVLCACVVIQYCKNIDHARAHAENTAAVVDLGRGWRRLRRGGRGGRVQEPLGEGLDGTIRVEIRRHGRLLLRSAATRRIAPRAENRFRLPPDDSYITTAI